MVLERRNRMLNCHRFITFFIAIAMTSIVPAAELRFERVVLNAESDFEASGVADLDRDGALDVICGDVWYAGPDFKRRLAILPIDRRDGYRLDFSNVPMDINGDGWPDVVSCNWHDRSVLWRENPGAAGGEWREHLVDRPGNMETAIAADVDGDGVTDYLPDVAQKTVWYRIEEGRLVPYVVSATIGGHGIGFGDVNGDGRGDILAPGGWFEAPLDRLTEEWTWHPEWNLGAAGISIILHDFTGDGLQDLLWGMGHDYGLFWLEQTSDPDPEKKWLRREVDTSWSQAHSLVLADLDGDGSPEIVTGKRRYAHNGNDPGGEDPQIVAVYSFDRASKSFTRQIIHEGGPDGAGLAISVADVDSDGDLDLVLPGKSGLFLYLQE